VKPGRVVLIVLLLLLTGCGMQSRAPISGAEGAPDAALQAYTQLGLQYLQAGDTVSAKGSLQRAIAIDPKYGPAYNAMALVFQVERDFDLAEEYFRKSVEFEPMSAMVHNNFGAFLFAQQRYEEACRHLARATEDPFYPLRAQAFENLGRCYRIIERQDVAEHAFRRALDLSHNRPIAQIELADLLLVKGDSAEAMFWFRQFRDLVDQRRVEHSPLSLWVGIRVARESRDVSLATTYSLLLRNLFPDSEEYRQFKEAAH